MTRSSRSLLLQGGHAALLGEAKACPACEVPNCLGHPDNVAANLGKVQFEEWGDNASRKEKPMAEAIVTTGRVFERRPIMGSGDRTTKVLVHAAGATISKDEAQRLNVGPDGRQADVPLNEGLSIGPASLHRRTKVEPAATRARKPRKR